MHAFLVVSRLLFVVLNLFVLSVTESKKVSGTVRLSGENSDVLLTKFAIGAHARGSFRIKFSSQDMYEDESPLKVHLFLDTNWKQYQKATLCSERTRLAHSTHSVAFEYGSDNKWRADVQGEMWQASVEHTHYWYVVIDDCSLEQRFRDYKIPILQYDLEIFNEIRGSTKRGRENGQGSNEGILLTHLSADEAGMRALHTITLAISVLLTCLMGMRIGMLLAESSSVHMALLLATAATGCDALASLSELLHLRLYEINGYGSYTLDAMSTHFEAVCDSIVALLLLSIAAGWTLPSDAVNVSSGASNGTLKSLLQGLRSPVGSLSNHSLAGWLAVSTILVHVSLAQWGRTYDDDFDSYHALEHPPGRILMLFRICLGVLLVVSCVQTAKACPNNVGLERFYGKLAIVGTLWFQSLPLTTWFCGWALPYYQRHPAVATGAAFFQTSSLVGVAWLVSAHSDSSSYHKLSRLGQERKGNLTDQLATTSSIGEQRLVPSTWKIGKAKIRLD